MGMIPNSVKIGCHDVTVVRAESWPTSDPDILGEAFPESNEIYLKANLADSQAFSVLLHEAMHFMNGTIDHALLDSLAEQLAQFLLDNGLIDED